MGASAGAAPFVAPATIRAATDSVNIVENVQFFWADHNYCWYDDGWTARAGTGAICTYSPGLVGAAAMAGIIGAGDTPIRITRVAAAVTTAERSLVAVRAVRRSLVAVRAVERSLVAVRAVERSLVALAAEAVVVAVAVPRAAAEAVVAAVAVPRAAAEVVPRAAAAERGSVRFSVCGRKAFHGTSTKDHEWRPPQLAASFISNRACNVAYWQILLQKSFCTADQKFSGL